MLPNCVHICYQFEQKPNRKVAWVDNHRHRTFVINLIVL